MPKIRRVGDGAREVQAYPGVWVTVDKGEEVDVSDHAAYGAPANAGFEDLAGAPHGTPMGGLLEQSDQWVEVKVRQPKQPKES